MRVHGSNTRVSQSLRELRARKCRGQLSVHRNGRSAKTREFVVLTGFSPEHNLGVYNNNVDTIERALTERYFLCKDGEGFRPAFEVGPSDYRTPELSEFRREVLAHMPHLPILSSSAVVEMYRGPKWKVYEAARRSLQEERLTAEDARLTMFSKFEKQDVAKAPRGINPRSSRYNLRLGKFIKHAEHHFFSAINKAFGRRTPATVIKGFNADRSAEILLNKWQEFAHPVAVGLDATKFDMHVSVPALQYEHSFYTSLFPGNKELVQLLQWQLKNRGTAYTKDGKVKFEMEGTRCSGDLNTSLGNCIIMCALVWEYAHIRGVRVELANNGDDCVVFMEEHDLPRFMDGFARWFRTKGFAMVVEEPVYEFEQIEFCQTHPVQLVTGWRMVRNLTAVLRKDPMCLIPIPNRKVYTKWLDAVGTCGGALSGGVPLHHAFYEMFKRNGTPSGKLVEQVYRNRSQLFLGRGLRAGISIDAVARVSYYYAFGVLPDTQVVIEEILRKAELDLSIDSTVEREWLQLLPGFNVE